MQGSGESDLDLWLHNISVEVLARDVSESPSGAILYRFERGGRHFLRVENNEHPTPSSYRLCELPDTSRCNRAPATALGGLPSASTAAQPPRSRRSGRERP
jgi:hypothetical protein